MSPQRKTQAPKEPQTRKPLEWHIPETLPLVRSNWAAVQYDEEDFTIAFFEIRRPFLFGTEVESLAKLEKIETIPAVCVARVSISPQRAENLMDVLQRMLDQYKEQKANVEKATFSKKRSR